MFDILTYDRNCGIYSLIINSLGLKLGYLIVCSLCYNFCFQGEAYFIFLIVTVSICDLRRWVQAVFSLSEFAIPEAKLRAGFPGQVKTEPRPKENHSDMPVNDFELDFSEGVAIDMFGIPPSQDNEVCLSQG